MKEQGNLLVARLTTSAAAGSLGAARLRAGMDPGEMLPLVSIALVPAHSVQTSTMDC